jgi:hypothetical protein
MKYKVILTRRIEQFVWLEVEADDLDTAKTVAEHRHREGLEWDDESVEYGPHGIHDGKGQQLFHFAE